MYFDQTWDYTYFRRCIILNAAYKICLENHVPGANLSLQVSQFYIHILYVSAILK